MKRLTKVDLTNLSKVLYPKPKVTKAQVIEYYVKMAPRILSLVVKRPVVLNRFPNGVDEDGFYEKDAPLGTPPWVQTFKRYSEAAQREISYIVCNGLDTLVWLANLAALEIHMTLSTVDSWDSPDLVLFDFDPAPSADIEDVVDVALMLKEKLDVLGLRSYVKTSGKRGLHALVPIASGYTFQQTREFVHQIARAMAEESEVVTSEFSRRKEPGKVFIDYRQNSHGRTVICPYSLRATANATVSTPLDWKDVRKGLKPDEFNLFTVVDMDKDPWKGFLEERQKLDVY